jgi:methyl-accepting chemotaxis protein
LSEDIFNNEKLFLPGENLNSVNSTGTWDSCYSYLKENLTYAIDRLSYLTNNTENEFLAIGHDLQIFYKSAGDITGLTRIVTETVSDKVLKNSINDLNILLSRIQEYLSNSSSDMSQGGVSLSEILKVLDKALDELSGFKRIVKHLRMLGISTRIETARLSYDDAGFIALAENVEKLSAIINDKSANIKHKAEELIRVVKETISSIINLEAKQRQQTSLILNDINENLNSLNEKYGHCSEKADIIESKASLISQNISHIVSSIQFHDITRQQIEHVVQALNSLGERISESVISPSDDHQSKLVYTHNLCVLQSMQLKHTKDELFNAVEAIIKSLDGVRINVSDVIAEAQNILSDNSEFNGANIIEDLEKGFSGISSSLNKSSEIRGELTNSMQSANNTIRNLSEYIGEIDEIGSEIELIALNSSVKAAHTGSEGAALGVLAESIQRLSSESKDTTKSVSENLRKISSVSESLYKSIDQNAAENNSRELTNIHNEISAQLESLLSLDKETFDKLSVISSSFEDLNKDISDSISKINVHNTTAEIIEQISKNLDEITNFISMNVDPELLNKPEDMQELTSKYTMNSERNIHLSFLKSKNGENIIEKSSLDENIDENSDDLGDNVELF